MKNIFLTLFSHQWKSFWRSRGAGKSVGMQIVIGFIILYILANAIVLGFTLRSIIKHQFPEQDGIKIFFTDLFFTIFLLILTCVYLAGFANAGGATVFTSKFKTHNFSRLP